MIKCMPTPTFAQIPKIRVKQSFSRVNYVCRVSRHPFLAQLTPTIIAIGIAIAIAISLTLSIEMAPMRAISVSIAFTRYEGRMQPCPPAPRPGQPWLCQPVSSWRETPFLGGSDRIPPIRHGEPLPVMAGGALPVRVIMFWISHKHTHTHRERQTTTHIVGCRRWCRSASLGDWGSGQQDFGQNAPNRRAVSLNWRTWIHNRSTAHRLRHLMDYTAADKRIYTVPKGFIFYL